MAQNWWALAIQGVILCNPAVLNFDYAIAVGVCTLVALVGLRVAMPWMRAARRKRTDRLLVRINEFGDVDGEGNDRAAGGVATSAMSEPKKTRTDG